MRSMIGAAVARQLHRAPGFVGAAAIFLVAAANLCYADAAAAAIRSYTIDRQPLSSALKEFAAQSDLQLIYTEADVGSATTKGVKGQWAPRDALALMLEGTNLEYEITANDVVVIHKAAASPAAMWSNYKSALRLAENGSGAATIDSSGGPVTDSLQLDEVIVTTQKVNERLQDVPVPVTVLNTEALTETQQLRLQDYYSRVPGLNLSVGGAAGDPILSIRGIQSSQSGPPAVGVVIDDVPYGSSSAVGGQIRGQPDIDPGDLARIEVLRGPQGTLYGASSIGGLLKFVTVDPSTQRWSGRVEAGTSSLFNGIEPGYNFRGSVNIPVNDTTALRASAFKEVDGGYIDNIQTGQDGINRRTLDGGRVAMLWKPSEVVSLKLSALLQNSKRDGADVASLAPGFGDLQIRLIPSVWKDEEKSQAYSLTLTAKLGSSELTSLTGYNVDHLVFWGDLTRVSAGYWDDLVATQLHTSGAGAVDFYAASTHKVSEEVRWSVPITSRIKWLLGGFYTYETTDFMVDDSAADTATGTPLADGLLYGQTTRGKYEEYAAFTNISYDITDQFNVQLGGRAAENNQTYSVNRFGPQAANWFSTLTIPDFPSKGTAVTYLLTPQYKISPDLMAYIRLASGYRAGGPNVACTAGIPCSFGPERTNNYELGLKADFFDHIISVDTSLYYIGYTDIQVGLSDPTGTIGYTANLGRAKSQGLELSVEARPVHGLTIATWVAWDDATLTSQHLPPGDGTPGQRLPYSARFSGNFSVDQEFAVRDGTTAFVGAAVSYVGDRYSTAQKFPGYAKTDLRAGLKYGSWSLTAFANNVINTRGVLGGGADYAYQYPDPNTYTFIAPRTVGLSLTKTF